MSSHSKRVFTEIYKDNKWKNEESVSGSGSTQSATRFLVQQLDVLIQRFDIRSILDIPCGDFNWMQHLTLDGIDYHGADIVSELIAANQARFPQHRFSVLDLITDDLPAADLIICRDCMVHLPNDMVLRALTNIRRSSSRFLLATTFVWDGIPNLNVQTGQWRKLNLELEPFHLPRPDALIVEGNYQDKSMGLWPTYQLPKD